MSKRMAGFWSSVAGDARHAARMLMRNRVFTFVVVAALSLGIGATTAIFTVVNRVLLQPLQYKNADRIVTVGTRTKGRPIVNPRITGGDFVDVSAETGSFSAISSYFGGELGVQVGGRGEFTGVFWINPGFLRVFGVVPVEGRLIEDNDAGAAGMVSLPFAQRTFGDGAAALGKTLRVENQAYTIAGILPAGFQFPAKADVWLAAPAKPENLNRTAFNYSAVAKLQPGVSLHTTQAQLDTISARLAAAYPASNRDKSFAAIPLQERLVSGVRSTLYLLLGAVGLVLLIACANVANLLLARTPARAREVAVRSALGASRWRIVRQLTVENLMIALVAAAAGVVLAKFGIAALLRAAPANLPRLGEVQLDRTALWFAVAASMLSSLFFGLAPAWQAARIEVTEALKRGGSRGVLGRGSHGLRHGLIVAEIALSFVLAIGAGLLFRSFVALTNVQLGFRSEGMLVMYAHAPAKSMPEYLQVGRDLEGLLGHVRELPGVTAAATVMGLPTGQYGSNGSFAVEGKQEFGKSHDMPEAGFRLASPGYFAAMGVPILRGRDFTAEDVYDAPFVATVSAALVHQVFPHEDPVGQRIQMGLDSRNWVTIVGVVGDVRTSPAVAPGPEIYMPLQQHPTRANEVQVVVRTAVPPASVSAAVRQKVQAMLPETATKFTTMETMLADSVATPHFRTVLLGVFAALALLLAMAGVYGVMAQVTAERTVELGVRLALGATPGGVMSLILRKAGLLAAIGLAIGMAGSFALSRVLTGMLFGLQATDRATYIAVLLGVTVTTLAAAAGPAWRAGRINPVEAMREE
jgi:putative ABC transport system permease protein